MIIRIRIAHWRITLTLYEVTDIIGINSLLPDGNHILMWDFDNIPLLQIKITLMCIQKDYELPQIRILNTGKQNHYIAYCFKRCSWWDTKKIIAATPFVCDDYFKWGVFRKRFTLRVTPKEKRKIKLVAILPSSIKEDVNISELNSWVKGAGSMRNSFLDLSSRSITSQTSLTTNNPRWLVASAQNMRHSLTIHR